jgi:hypothetical protein
MEAKMAQDNPQFGADDISLLEKVINLVPDLRVVAYAAQVARQRLSYPINNYDALRPLFDEAEQFSYGNWRISMKVGRKHFPAAFFPITSEDDFISKVHVALAIGQTSHVRGDHHVPTQDVLKTLGVPLDEIRKTQPHLFKARKQG